MPNEFKEKLVSEFNNILHSKRVVPRRDWGLIWILSADQINIKKKYKTRNETRERFETGLKLAKKISKLRINSKKTLTLKNIRLLGPKIYFSGYNSHNKLMRKYIGQQYFEKQYKFPDDNIIIGPYENILHTDHQFQKFPQNLISKNAKVVIVTSAYHIPRIKRYLAKYQKKFQKNKIIICPSLPLNLDRSAVDLEIEKILKYTHSKILPV